MKERARSPIVCIVALIIISLTVFSLAHAALWNKRYLVKQDLGVDILCDPYTVKKDDWVYKIFRQKGEISEANFPTFLEIFKRLNLQVDDIDRIYPGDLIFIPLKMITEGTLPFRVKDSVTIPFASISGDPVETILIRKGDTVSELITRLAGGYGTQAYYDGLRRFKALNPQLTDLDDIMVGQRVQIPAFLVSGPNQAPLGNEIEGPLVDESSNPPMTGALRQVATLLEASLFDQGEYHFPMTANADLRLDLALFPVMQLKDLTRILFIKSASEVNADLNIIKSHWKDLQIVRMPAPPVSVYQLLDQITTALNKGKSRRMVTFNDGDVKVEIKAKWILEMKSWGEAAHHYICLSPAEPEASPYPEAAFRYLTKHHMTYWEIKPDGRITGTSEKSRESQPAEAAPPTAFIVKLRPIIRNLSSAMGWTFQENVSISFPYAGSQVNAVSNLLSIDSNQTCLVDFGSFAGETISSIEASGLKVVSLSDSDDTWHQIQNLFDVLSVKYTKNPSIPMSSRNDGHGVFFNCQGLMVDKADSQVLLTPSVFSDEVSTTLENRGIRILKVNPIQ